MELSAENNRAGRHNGRRYFIFWQYSGILALGLHSRLRISVAARLVVLTSPRRPRRLNRASLHS